MLVHLVPSLGLQTCFPGVKFRAKFEVVLAKTVFVDRLN